MTWAVKVQIAPTTTCSWTTAEQTQDQGAGLPSASYLLPPSSVWHGCHIWAPAGQPAEHSVAQPRLGRGTLVHPHWIQQWIDSLKMVKLEMNAVCCHLSFLSVSCGGLRVLLQFLSGVGSISEQGDKSSWVHVWAYCMQYTCVYVWVEFQSREFGVWRSNTAREPTHSTEDRHTSLVHEHV